MTAPDWLLQRGGALQLGGDGNRWFVIFNQQPNYSLTAVPVDGKFGCVLRQTINGQRFECPGTYASEDEAVQGGLNDLRKALGWG